MNTYRFDPVVPAKCELLTIDEVVLIFVEHREHLLQLLISYHINVTFIVPEQRTANQCEFSH